MEQTPTKLFPIPVPLNLNHPTDKDRCHRGIELATIPTHAERVTHGIKDSLKISACLPLPLTGQEIGSMATGVHLDRHAQPQGQILSTAAQTQCLQTIDRHQEREP
jgi:hypothetical protein